MLRAWKKEEEEEEEWCRITTGDFSNNLLVVAWTKTSLWVSHNRCILKWDKRTQIKTKIIINFSNNCKILITCSLDNRITPKSKINNKGNFNNRIRANNGNSNKREGNSNKKETIILCNKTFRINKKINNKTTFKVITSNHN